MECRHYRDFYYCLKNYAEKKGCMAELLITNDSKQTEYNMIQWAKSVMALGVAVITCLNEKEAKEAYAGFKKVCFVERKGAPSSDYIGFVSYSIRGSHHKVVIWRYSLIVDDAYMVESERVFV